MNPWLHGLVWGTVVAGLVVGVGGVASWWERKFAGRMQNRVGPNLIGPLGFYQWIADALKMMQKADIVPRSADRALFNLAPALPVALVLATAGVVPLAGWWNGDVYETLAVVPALDVAILWVLALAGLMVFPTWMAGWASNNKYALLAGMRAVAQGVSYEIPMVLAALVPVIVAGSLRISDIVAWQADHGWLVWRLPVVGALAFALFFIASLAEANRIPFDIPEAESELVAGIYVEYTGLKMGMFVLSEYLHTFVASALASALFLGGPHGPGPWWLSPLWMALKTGALFTLIYWIRWSWYRFRSDQLMALAWRWLVPGGLGLVACSALAVAAGWMA